MDTVVQSFLQSLIDTQDHPFVLIDRDYRIVAANRAYHATYGSSPEQVVGRRCYEISHHRDRPCHLFGEDCPHRQVFETREIHQVLHTHYNMDGLPERVNITGHPVSGPAGEVFLGEIIRRLPAAAVDSAGMTFVGRSPVLLRAIDLLRQAAATDAHVLLLGESGVGKELAVHYVHEQSRRRTKPILTLDCATLTETLFESEIFGHERGTFTGCAGRRRGLFEQAHEGTLFLDEIGELPLAVQAKLLRILETGEFRRVGGRDLLRADVRIVAATNVDLRERVAAGGFREDLYYRLACISVRMPALRERRSDIPILAETFLSRMSHRSGARCYLTGEAAEKLSNYDFPGNVRELRNVLQRAVALSEDGAIGHGDIQLEGELHGPPAQAADQDAVLPIHAIERQHIARLLERFHGDKKRVAQALGVSERTIYRRLKIGLS